MYYMLIHTIHYKQTVLPLYKLLILISCALIPIRTSAAQHINVIGEHFPPFQFQEKGQIKGFSIDLINALLAKTSQDATFNISPWARAFYIAQTTENTLLLTVTRTKFREKQFKWIGSIAQSTSYLWALKSNKQASKLMIRHPIKDRVAVQRDSHFHEHLVDSGFDKKFITFSVTTKKQAIRMLYQGRAEYIMGSEHMLHARIKALGLDPTRIQPIAPIKTAGADLSIALSKQTSDDIVQAMIEAFKELKRDGSYQALLKKWRLD